MKLAVFLVPALGIVLVPGGVTSTVESEPVVSTRVLVPDTPAVNGWAQDHLDKAFSLPPLPPLKPHAVSAGSLACVSLRLAPTSSEPLRGFASTISFLL